MDSEHIPKIACCCCCCLVVVFIVLLTCVSTIEPIEYGIVYNSFSKKIDKDKVYDGGWHWLSPISSFYTFPATLVNLDFTEFPGSASVPINLKDQDGQQMKLQLSLQYKLIRDKLPDLYSEFQMRYEQIFISRIDAVLRQQVGNFDSTMFWTDREKAGQFFKTAINTEL